MASRLTLPRLPRVPAGEWIRSGRARGERIRTWRAPSGEERRLLLWRIVCAPYWVGSEAPAPALPARDGPAAEGGLAGNHVVRHLDGLARRIWMARTLSILVRSLWLGLLFGCGWMATEIAGGPVFRRDGVIAATVAALGLGLVFAALARPTRRQVARMLDRSFALHDRLVTALDDIGLDVPAAGGRAPIAYLQVADSANVLTSLRSHRAFAVRPPVREIVLAIACGLTLAALFFLRGAGGTIPAAAEGAVPTFTSAAERMAQAAAQQPPAAAAVAADAPTARDVQAKADRSESAQRDLQQLAQALADQAMTRPAADAIQAGDYPKAADEIRSVAEGADRLSPAARAGLTADLNAAAGKMSGGDPALADATRKAAEGMAQGGQAAKDGMSRLADAVQKAGGNVASQGDLANQMREAQSADAQRTQSGADSANADGGQPPATDPSAAGAQPGGQPGGEPGRAAGSGSDAQPGAATDGKGQPSDPANGDPSAGQPGGRQAGDPGQQGAQAASAGDSAKQGGSNAAGQGGAAGDAAAKASSAGQGAAGPSQPGDKGGSGDGAGSGGSTQQTASGQPSKSAPGQGGTSDPNSPKPSVTDGSGSGGGGAGSKPAESRASITLSRSPDGAGVQTSGGGGAPSVGSGSGSAVSSGTGVQGDVAAAGPDSNRVPTEYRSVVEAFFSGPEKP